MMLFTVSFRKPGQQDNDVKRELNFSAYIRINVISIVWVHLSKVV